MITLGSNACLRSSNVLQGSNQEMVDRGVFDGVPNVTERWNLKHETSRTSTIHTVCIKNQHVLQGSNQEMVDRGVFDDLPDILETWNLKCGISKSWSTTRKCIRNHQILQGFNQEMVDRGVFDGVPEKKFPKYKKLAAPSCNEISSYIAKLLSCHFRKTATVSHFRFFWYQWIIKQCSNNYIKVLLI